MKALALTMVTLLAATGLIPAAAQAAEGPLYVAMGDSISRGDGAPAGQGFVDLYLAHLRGAGETELQLSNLAVGGETSSSMRSNGQLDAALAAIGGPSDTRVATLGIGGNDGAAGHCPAGYNTPPCPFKDNYFAILQALRSALDTDPGDETFKVLQYFNPAAGTGSQEEAVYDFGLLGSDGKVDCSGSGYAVGLNDHIACIGKAHGALPIDTYPTFKAGGRALMADALHPNSTGHAYIACLFEHPERAGSPKPCEPTPSSPAPPPPAAPGSPSPRALELAVAAAARQRVLRQRGVVVFVTTNQSADVRASATISLPRTGTGSRASAGTRLVRLRTLKMRVATDTRTRLRLRLASKDLRVVRRTLRTRRSLPARVNVRATADTGSSRALVRRIRLVG